MVELFMLLLLFKVWVGLVLEETVIEMSGRGGNKLKELKVRSLLIIEEADT